MMDVTFKKRRNEFLICLFLSASIIAVYYQSTCHNFVNYDDESYVTENPNVNKGLSLYGIKWAFTTGHAANWHPLTWLSHMLDSELYGLNPMGHHWTNIQLHIVNAILLFLFLNWTTKAFWRSCLVASLFALHPLHVESVAWVSERKDVLSAFFWILSLWAYAGYVQYAKKTYYLFLVIFFTLGLMSKPMIVTLPFTLLLLDFWPLARFQSIILERKINVFRVLASLVWEKIPLFAFSAISCFITFFVQKYGGAVASIEAIPFKLRVANAFISYVRYIGKMVWPLNLSVFYPQQQWPTVQVLASGILLVGLSFVVIRASRSFPYLFTGWFWYLGTLIPVIGLVQVGSQSMADRYTYIPLIGLFVIISWGMSDISTKWQAQRTAVAVFSSIIIIFYMTCTWFQIGYWQNGITLFQHGVKMAPDNSIVHCELAHAMHQHGKFDEAIVHFTKAIEINPKFGIAHNNLGVTLARKGDFKAAVHHHLEALKINPKNPKAHNNLGNVLAQQGNVKDAIDHYKKAIDMDPSYAGAYYNLGKIFANQEKFGSAIHFYQRTLHYSPNMTQALYNLSWILSTCKDEKYRNGKQAVKLAERLCKITQDNQALAFDVLAAAYAETKKFDKAVLMAQTALELGLQHGPRDLALDLKARPQLYSTGHPFRDGLSEKK
jgi:tetratricopeptide (TPR) repeat protein